ncbi:hypothetical protein [Acetobacter indonesiensis]
MSRRTSEDVRMWVLRSGIDFEEHDVHDRRALIDKMDDIAKRGSRPILHFDCHGSAESGLFLEPSGEYLSWHALADALRPININTGNNLVCIFGVCHGFFASGEMSLVQETPFAQIIAPLNEIKSGFLEDRLPRFYASLFETKNFSEAFTGHIAEKFETLHCQELLADCLARYTVKFMMGRKRKASIEELVSEAISVLGIEPTTDILRLVRRVIKNEHRMTPELIQYLAQPFLINKLPEFTADMINKRAEANRSQIT